MLHAVGQSKRGVAMLVRTQILEGLERHVSLFRPLQRRLFFAQHVERVPIAYERVVQAVDKKTPPTAYGWLVHDWCADFPVLPGPAVTIPLTFIPPSRERYQLEHDHELPPCLA